MTQNIDWKVYWRVLHGLQALERSRDTTLSDQERSVERMRFGELVDLVEDTTARGLNDKGKAIWEAIVLFNRATEKQGKALALAIGQAMYCEVA